MTPFRFLLMACLLLAPALTPPAAAAEQRRPSDELILLSAQEGMLDLLHQRLDGGANIDSTDYRGRTALMLAARSGHQEVVEALLRRGAEVERVDFEGASAPIYALRQRHVTVLHLILGWLHGTPAYRRQLAKTLEVAHRAGDAVTERRLKELYQATDAEQPLRPAVAEGRWPRQDAISTDPLLRWLPWGYRGDEDLPPAPPPVLTPGRAPAAPAAFQAAPVAAPARPALPPPPTSVPNSGPLSDLPPIQ